VTVAKLITELIRCDTKLTVFSQHRGYEGDTEIGEVVIIVLPDPTSNNYILIK